MGTIHVSTAGYEFSHGRRPSGRGGWAFFIGRSEDPTFIPGMLLYSEARKIAQGIARDQGASFIRVAP